MSLLHSLALDKIRRRQFGLILGTFAILVLFSYIVGENGTVDLESICANVNRVVKTVEEEEMEDPIFQGPIMSKWRGNSGAKLAEEIIQTYLSHRKDGEDQQQIARDVFNVSLPNDDPQGFPHAYPFLSGDTLRAFADVVYQKVSRPQLLTYKEVWEVSPKDRKLQHGDIIFVRMGLVEDFAREVLPTLEKRFVLITHSGDEFAPSGVKSSGMLDHELLLHWFSVNADRSHAKLSAVPIGIMDSRHLKEGQHSADREKLEKYMRLAPPVYSPNLVNEDDDDRPNLVYVNFSPASHPLRKKALKAFEEVATYQKFGELQGAEGQDEFWGSLVESKFVLSPPGVGEDCFRTWESVLLGAIPIVRKSSIEPIFKGAPVMVLDNLHDKVNETMFSSFSVATKSRRNVMAQFWFDLIKTVRDREMKKKTEEEASLSQSDKS